MSPTEAPMSSHRLRDDVWPVSRLAREGTAAFALFGVLLPAVLAVDQFFTSRANLALLLTCACVPLVVGFVVRRVRRQAFSIVLGFVVSISIGAGVLLHQTVPRTLSFGVVPSSSTLAALRAAIRSGASLIQHESAPVEGHPGLLLMVGGGLWFLGMLMDASAFRLGSTGDSVAPALGAIVLAGILGPGDHRTLFALWFAAAAGLFVVLHHQYSVTSAGWLGNRLPSGWRLPAAGVLAAAVATVGAGLVAPQLPGYGATPTAFDFSFSNAPRKVISPFVSLAAQLSDQSDVEMFVVRSPTPAYWRVTGLERFDGTRFTIRGDRGPNEADPPGATRPFLHEVEILGLQGSPWVPVAYRAGSVDGPGRPSLRGSTRTVRINRTTRRGDVFAVTAAVPVVSDPGPTPASAQSPDDPLLLESPISAQAAALAQRFAAEYPGEPYLQLLSMQQWFRSAFVYDLGVAAPLGDNALDDFLFRSRTGFCQHFATGFAALARSLGYPSRIGIGFVSGERLEDGRWLVRGRDAHAWPEVWIAGLGWTAFEPTPGRRVPAWAPGAATRTPSIDAAANPPVTRVPTTKPPTPRPVQTTPSAASDDVAGDNAWWPWVVLGLAGCLVAGAAAMQHRRRRVASDPVASVLAAWRQGAHRMGAAFGHCRPDESCPGYAERMAPHLAGDIAVAFRDLAALADAAAYGPGAVGPAEANRAISLAATLRDGTGRRATAQPAASRQPSDDGLAEQPERVPDTVGPRS